MSFKIGMNGINQQLLFKEVQSDSTQETSAQLESVETAKIHEGTIQKRVSSGNEYKEKIGLDISAILKRDLFRQLRDVKVDSLPEIGCEYPPDPSESKNPLRIPSSASSTQFPYLEDEVGKNLFGPGSITSRDKFDFVTGEGNGGVKGSNDESEPYEPSKQDSSQDNSNETEPGKGVHGGDNTDWELVDGMLRPADGSGTMGPKWLGNPAARQNIKIPGLGGLDDSADPNPDGQGGPDHNTGKPKPSGSGSNSGSDDDQGNGNSTNRDSENWGILGPYIRPQELQAEAFNISSVLKNTTKK